MQFITFSILEKKYIKLLELVDGAKDIVETFKTEGKAQEEWKKQWLIDARTLINDYVNNKNQKGE
jgi:hypothetical protein